MTWRPLSGKFRRRRRDGAKEDETTQDGTEDLYGRPASRRTTGGWRGAWFVIGQQVFTNIAFFGVSSNLIIYITTIMHESNSAAATNVNNWFGAGYITPLIASFIADSYCGRFLSCVIFTLIELAGLVMLTVIGNVHSLRPAQCPNEDLTCPKASLSQASFFYAALYVVDLGAGGVQGTVVPFGADQFDEEDEKERTQNSSYFNLVYNTVLIGSFVSSLFFVYLQENGSVGLAWGIGLGIMVLSLVSLVSGVRVYRYHRPGGNPVTRMSQVLVACARKWRQKISTLDDLYDVHDTQPGFHNIRKIQHTNKFRFLDKAALVTVNDSDRRLLQNPWHVCSVTQVEELKFLLRVFPIFLFSIMYTVCYSQLTTIFIEQGATLDRKLRNFEVPAASLPIFECLSVFFWIPLYDRVLVPFLRKLTGNHRGISELKRIGIGLSLSILAMVTAALVEIRRLHVVHEHGLEDDTETPVPMSFFWEVPQYFFMGASEVFTYVGLMEFFYDQAPDAIRSLGSSIAYLDWALGYFLATAILKVVGHITTRGGSPGWVAANLNRGRIDLFFWLLAVMSFVNLVGFVLCAMQFEYTVTQGPVTRTLEGTPQHQDKEQLKDDHHQQQSSFPERQDLPQEHQLKSDDHQGNSPLKQ